MGRTSGIEWLRALLVSPRGRSGPALKEAAALAVSRYIDQALTLLTPMVLVRLIDPLGFGEYRLFWLLGTTIALLAPLGIPNSLLYFFPRLDSPGQARFLGQALLFTLLTSLFWTAALFASSSFLPASVARLLHGYGLPIVLFAVTWTLSSLLDTLPIAAHRVMWQSRMTIAVAAVRTALLLGTALHFRDVEKILFAVTAFTVFRTGVLFYFIWKYCGLHVFPIHRQDLTQQVQYSLPFGLAGLLYSLRRQAEQWIVAAMFSAAAFGAFTIALSLLLPFDVLRNVIATLLLPRMSRAQFAGSLPAALELNRRGNVLSFFVIMPGVAFLCAFATEVVGILFTARYLAAAPVMRIYLVQVAIMFEVTTVMNVLRLGRFQISYAMFLLPLSIALSWAGASLFGLPGAAIGSLVAQLIAYVIVFFRLARVLDVPISKLQDWRTLALIALCAIAAAVVAFIAGDLSGLRAIWRCLLGAGTLVLVYFSLVGACGLAWVPRELLGRGTRSEP